jgi:hypothetical protein
MTELLTVFITTVTRLNGNEAVCLQLRNKLDQFKFDLDISDDYFTVDELVNHIDNTDFKGLFGNDTQKGVEIFFNNHMKTSRLEDLFTNMAAGINETNYSHQIYSKIHEPFPEESSKLTIIGNLMNKFLHFKRMEMNYALAKFVEMYYLTKEGKIFIESFNDCMAADFKAIFENRLKPREQQLVIIPQKKAYFKKLFKKMNESSFCPVIFTDANDNTFYRFQKKSTLNGIFIGFEDNQVRFSVGLKLDEKDSAEGIEPMHHGVLARTFADAVYKSLKQKVNSNGTDQIYLMRKYWEHVVNKDDASKNAFLSKAIYNLLTEYNIIKNGIDAAEAFKSATKTLENGKANGQLKEMVLTLHPALFMSRKLGFDVDVNNEVIMLKFFAGTPDCGFKLNYLQST